MATFVNDPYVLKSRYLVQIKKPNLTILGVTANLAWNDADLAIKAIKLAWKDINLASTNISKVSSNRCLTDA